MKFNTIFVAIILLILVHCLFMFTGRSHPSTVKTEELIVHISSSSSSFQFWVLTLLALNLFVVFLIWLKIFGPATSEKEMKSSEQQTTTEMISAVDDSQPTDVFHCFDLIHIRRSTSKMMVADLIQQIKCIEKFGVFIKPDIGPDRKLRMCIEMIQYMKSSFLIIDYDHTIDIDTCYASSLREMFRSVFKSSNEILTAGNLGAQMKSLTMFRLFSYDQVMRMCSLDERNEHRDMISDQAKRFLTCSCTVCDD